ncbi:hypothetical protein CHARACLAT_017498 [Characodon lateralis]|uniref:Uncharacterized protein n=1 Tax=Characodon lateralis TaxID=208331 RepID=A0ABU7EDD1_9TELE|nr:hypothetical protein [Characodon lateralis]
MFLLSSFNNRSTNQVHPHVSLLSPSSLFRFLDPTCSFNSQTTSGSLVFLFFCAPIYGSGNHLDMLGTLRMIHNMCSIFDLQRVFRMRLVSNQQVSTQILYPQLQCEQF